MTPIFETEAHKSNERAVGLLLAKAWHCVICPFGHLSPFDFYAQRYGKTLALIEVKCRTHSTTKYDSVFLTVRKWRDLERGQREYGVPALFVVRFTDELRYIRWSLIDGSTSTMAGRTDRGAVNDFEPMIHVPVASMPTVVPRGT